MLHLSRIHSCTVGRFFWCWNRNSGDTGGLVAEDWATLEWEKLAYLSLIGLRPWFLDWVLPIVLIPKPSQAWCCMLQGKLATASIARYCWCSCCHVYFQGAISCMLGRNSMWPATLPPSCCSCK